MYATDHKMTLYAYIRKTGYRNINKIQNSALKHEAYNIHDLFESTRICFIHNNEFEHICMSPKKY